MALAPARAERLKDLVQVEGARDNQLIGYGLVVGLSGTGDQTTQVPYSVQAIQNMLRQLGLTLNPNAFLQPTAVAAVMVTADLPTFMQVGQRIDVTVSSMGNANSLCGGVLLMTELRGADGQVYAIAQGSLLVSGFEASGQAASTTVNIPTVAHIPDGATVERPVKAAFAASDAILLDLDERSFGNAARITDAINTRMGGIAASVSPGQVARSGAARRRSPGEIPRRIAGHSGDDRPAARGGRHRRAKRHRGDGCTTSRSVPPRWLMAGFPSPSTKSREVSQPSPFSRGGQTVVVPRTTVKAEEKELKIIEFKAAPRDLGYRAQSQRHRCALVGLDRDSSGVARRRCASRAH